MLHPFLAYQESPRRLFESSQVNSFQFSDIVAADKQHLYLARRLPPALLTTLAEAWQVKTSIQQTALAQATMTWPQCASWLSSQGIAWSHSRRSAWQRVCRSKKYYLAKNTLLGQRLYLSQTIWQLSICPATVSKNAEQQLINLLQQMIGTIVWPVTLRLYAKQQVEHLPVIQFSNQQSCLGASRLVGKVELSVSSQQLITAIRN